jgi:hypothetical protein
MWQKIVTIARKVVGAVSIATRAWVMLLMSGGDGDNQLFLQARETGASMLEPYLGTVRTRIMEHGWRRDSD